MAPINRYRSRNYYCTNIACDDYRQPVSVEEEWANGSWWAKDDELDCPVCGTGLKEEV